MLEDEPAPKVPPEPRGRSARLVRTQAVTSNPLFNKGKKEKKKKRFYFTFTCLSSGCLHPCFSTNAPYQAQQLLSHSITLCLPTLCGKEIQFIVILLQENQNTNKYVSTMHISLFLLLGVTVLICPTLFKYKLEEIKYDNKISLFKYLSTAYIMYLKSKSTSSTSSRSGFWVNKKKISIKSVILQPILYLYFYTENTNVFKAFAFQQAGCTSIFQQFSS